MSMTPLLKSWLNTFIYFLFGICLYQECYTSAVSSAKCGSVFVTVSSFKGYPIELNWINNCKENDIPMTKISLYNMDIRKQSPNNPILYVEVNANDYPDGYYRTKTPFNMSYWPKKWRYNSTSTFDSDDSTTLPYWIVSFSNENEIIDIQALKLNPTWMSDNSVKLSPYQIGNLLIPGTHNSGCYGSINILGNYIITQSMAIWYQLVFGIRYLDLRIAYHQDKQFYINHDFIKVRRLQPVYEQIKAFIEKSPREVIIVDFHRFPFPSDWPNQLHEKFINYTLEMLGDYAFSKNELDNASQDKGPTMEQIWKAKKNIIFTYGKEEFAERYPQLWKPIPQAWADTLNVNSLKQYLEKSLNESNKTMFNALMAELTPTAIDIITGTNALRKLANDVNSNLTKWVRDEWNNRLNIVTSDFFLGNNVINVAIDINKNR